ncbi:MAG: hypothetical protein KC501_07805 [Myxococcales bacterium]|nr:hypothetical protein [Myxococcales bacterium]
MVLRSLAPSLLVLGCAKQPDAAEPRTEVAPAGEAAAKTETEAAATPETKAKTTPEPSPVPSEPPAHPRLEIPARPDLAVVVLEAGIVALGPDGKSVGMLLPGEASWCRVDPRGGVLWARRSGDLSMLDLEGGGPPVTVLEDPPETIVIAYADEELGRPAPHEFQDGVAVHMVDPPRLEAIQGCDGDMVYYCLDDDVEDFEAALAEQLGARAEALAEQPVPLEALAPIVARSEGRRAALADPGRAPAPSSVTVPADACEEAPEDCGSAEVLPGTRYWRVLVGNSRGDFYHEDFQLFDPASKEFFDPTRPTERSAAPRSGEVFEPRWISPSGELALGYDSLVSFEHGVIASGLMGVCGFWGGGFEP